MDRAGADEAKPDSKLHHVYDMISFSIAGFDRSNSIDHSSLFLTNSNWTAQVFQDAYGVEPQVLYPPVKADGINGFHWPDREKGFVSVGRIEESKNLGRSIEIVRNLNERGHDVHLHIIGSANDGEYSREIKESSNKYDYIRFEGEVSRSRLEELLASHKFGLHAKDHEHFGIAVAEMVSAGMIPFVPDSGGQVELVNSQGAVLYDDKSDAIEKISSVFNDPDLQQEIRKSLPDIDEDFGATRFRNEVKTIVNMELETNR
jgi:glycosyltransferase involved in cell wall biosynthesis